MAEAKSKSFKLRSSNNYLLAIHRIGEELDLYVYWNDSLAALPSLTKRQAERLATALQKFAKNME
jgi:hypothetical protein